MQTEQPQQIRLKLQEHILAYGAACQTGNGLLMQLAAQAVAEQITSAVPDKPTLADFLN